MEPAQQHVYTPTELNREVRIHLEAGFPRLLLEGEISNLSRPASGHLYFSLKDDRAQIRCALFRSHASRLAILPENGMKVIARGRIGLYEARGDYQMIVDGLRDAGEGELQRQFEELKKKLDDEGLFDPALKQPLPEWPRHIALVTSPRGAAVRDMLQVFRRRWPLAAIRLYPVRVQGAEAAAEIRQAIMAAERHGRADVIIVGRGGGSLEDLMAFNDESVARTIHAVRTPVVSAVGHETDFSISDFVADVRAATPTAAAELVSPDQAQVRTGIARLQRQLETRFRHRLQSRIQQLDHLDRRLQLRHPGRRLEEQRRQLARARTDLTRTMAQVMAAAETRLSRSSHRLAAQHPRRLLGEYSLRLQAARKSAARQIRQALDSRRLQLQDLARTLHAVSPLETLGRGYAVILDDRDERVISSVSQARADQHVTAQLRDGRLACRVISLDDRILDPDEDN